MKQLLDYLALREEVILKYLASEIILAMYSDSGYLNKTKARSQPGGHFFLLTTNDLPKKTAPHLLLHTLLSTSYHQQLR